MAWQAIQGAIYYWQAKFLYGSTSLKLPIAPFEGIAGLALVITFIILVKETVSRIKGAIEAQFKWKHWLAVGLTLFVFISLSIYIMTAHLGLNPSLIGIIGMLVFFILLLTGMPVPFVLILISLVFISSIRGVQVGLITIRSDIFISLAQYSWYAALSFILAGFLFFVSKFGEDIFNTACKWVGHTRGGLAITTILGSAAMSSIVGEPMSPTATMSAVAVPEMRKAKYDESLIAGSLVTGASLGPVIPPSIPFIIYGTLSGVSIGSLFLGGYVTGAIMVVALILAIYLWCVIAPRAGAKGPYASLREKINSLPLSAPLLFVFLTIIVGIYLGFMTPTEGGAVAVMVVLILGGFLRRFNWKKLATAFQTAERVIGMVFPLVVGSTIFTKFMVWAKFSTVAHDYLVGLSLSPIAISGIILIVFIVLGCFLDALTLMLIGVPIVHPIVVALGADPVWFGVLLSLAINIGVITPPYGLNLFVLHSVTDMKLTHIFRGALILLIPLLASMALVYYIPAILTWISK